MLFFAIGFGTGYNEKLLTSIVEKANGKTKVKMGGKEISLMIDARDLYAMQTAL